MRPSYKATWIVSAIRLPKSHRFTARSITTLAAKHGLLALRNHGLPHLRRIVHERDLHARLRSRRAVAHPRLHAHRRLPPVLAHRPSHRSVGRLCGDRADRGRGCCGQIRRGGPWVPAWPCHERRWVAMLPRRDGLGAAHWQRTYARPSPLPFIPSNRGPSIAVRIWHVCCDPPEPGSAASRRLPARGFGVFWNGSRHRTPGGLPSPPSHHPP